MGLGCRVYGFRVSGLSVLGLRGLGSRLASLEDGVQRRVVLYGLQVYCSPDSLKDPEANNSPVSTVQKWRHFGGLIVGTFTLDPKT